MYVDHDVINAGARLMQGALENGMPVDDEIEWAGLDEHQGRALQAILDDLGHNDFWALLRQVMERLPEPADEDEDAIEVDDAEVSR